jgi:hypothetical protein
MIKDILRTVKNNLRVKELESFQCRRIDINNPIYQTNTQSGVYCLMKLDSITKECEITYVGFSNNLITRIKNHTPYGKDCKKWNYCIGITVESEKRAREVETCLIIKFKPQHNNPKTWINPLKLKSGRKQYNDYLNRINKVLQQKIKRLSESDVKLKLLNKHARINYPDWETQQLNRLNGQPHKLLII